VIAWLQTVGLVIVAAIGLAVTLAIGVFIALSVLDYARALMGGTFGIAGGLAAFFIVPALVAWGAWRHG